MLFKNVSWHQFLVAALVFSLIWYGLLLPLIYRHRIFAWLEKRRARPVIEPLRRDWEDELAEDPDEAADDDLLGKAKLPEGVSRVSMNMFGFAPQIHDAEDSRFIQRGLVPDVIEELKSIFRILEKEDGTKADFISLFDLVKTKYTGIAGTPSERALNNFIRENALFPISDDELTQLWK